MHGHLNQLRAQEHIADLRAAAERSRSAAGDRLELKDGRRLRIRPIERQDRDRLRGLLARMAHESRYRRYFSPKPEFSERELEFELELKAGRKAATYRISAWDPLTQPPQHKRSDRCPSSTSR